MHYSIAVLAAWLCLGLSPAMPRAEIAVGIANPLSGPYAGSGARNLLAVMAAIERVNADGGVLGEELTLVTADDKCGMQEAVDAAERLVNAGVVMVVGHYCSHSSLLAAAIYDMAGIIMISPDSTHPRLTEENRPNVFRLTGRDDAQGREAARLIAERWPEQRIAIVHDGSTYGQGLALQTRRDLMRLDREPVLVETYDAKAADFAELIGKLDDAAVEVLYIGGYGPDAGRIAAAAGQAGLGLQIVGGDGLAMDAFWAEAGAAGDGAIFTRFAPSGGTEPQSVDGEPEPRVLQEFADGGLGAYAAVEVWAEAVSRAGTVDAKPVIHVLDRGHFDTARGTLAFDAKGDLAGDGWTWFVWHDGRSQPLELLDPVGGSRNHNERLWKGASGAAAGASGATPRQKRRV